MNNAALTEKITQLEAQLATVFQYINERKSTQLTHPLDDVSRRIIGSDIVPSRKTVASATQSVNESGTGTYNVAKIPNDFRDIVVNGITITVPNYA